MKKIEVYAPGQKVWFMHANRPCYDAIESICVEEDGIEYTVSGFALSEEECFETKEALKESVFKENQ